MRALKQVFPIPESSINRYGADFYAIYGVALVGPVADIAKSLGGYRVHNTQSSTVSFANSEQISKAPKAFSMRWAILRKMAENRLQVELPEYFHDFSHEKALFCSGVYRAPVSTRWRWMMKESAALPAHDRSQSVLESEEESRHARSVEPLSLTLLATV